MSEDRWSIAPLGCYIRRSVRQLCPLVTVLIQEKYATFRHNSERYVSVELGLSGLVDLPHAPLANEGGDIVAPYALESHLIRPETDEPLAPSVARA